MFLTDLNTDQLMLLLVPALPNMWALKHAMYHDFPTLREKYRWMLACVFLPCVGGLAYYFVGRKHASREKIDIFARKEERFSPSFPEDGSTRADAEESAPADISRKDKNAAHSGNSAFHHKKDDWSFACPEDTDKSSS